MKPLLGGIGFAPIPSGATVFTTSYYAQSSTLAGKIFMANNNYPTVLFNGSSLMQHAHSITQKVQNELSTATYEYLSAQPVDTLVQKLYTDNQIYLPYLRRDQIHHTHFEGYIGPYVEPPSQYSRLGQRKYQDISRGIIWAFHVGFVGDKRYFSLKPSKADSKHPLALLGEDKLTVYIPQRNNAMPQIEASFENTLALIDVYLKLQHETLLNYPMTFYRTIETVINGRLNSLKATRNIAATLRYPSAEQLPPPRAPTPQPQKPAPAPRPAEEPKPMVGNHLLLTGAGFSKNWGGLLASEVFNDLLSASGAMAESG
ncbi:hypothetical protein [Bradyrhizobium liaoningense]|uniref:hypothetical protein n=1 Tax=Bradyrhizobium liaoningense TaxID=43992 RepID=UPI001BABFDE1|nr:hypothetical protein [Bradyrhizobium liaoningense]MBR1005039.1 hypothetical protein [Bradyrhizobium liaoningense]